MLVIKEIKFKNMISNNEDIHINFTKKLKNHDDEFEKNYFFKASIKQKENSKYSEGILKNLALFGKNANYKSSILKAINEILKFIQSHSLKIENLIIKNYRNAIHDSIVKQSNIKINEIIKEILEREGEENIINNHFKNFYQKNVFDTSKNIKFEVIFFNIKSKETFLVEFLFSNIENKIFLSFKINNQKINWLEKNQNFNIFNFSLIQNNDINFSFGISIELRNALNFLLNEKFHKNISELEKFLKIIDPSISGLKEYKIQTKGKKISLKDKISIIRSYDQIIQIIDVNKLSTGTKNIIIHLYKVLANNFLMINEIENGLQNKLVELLLLISNDNNKQLIFTTHNSVIIEKYMKNYKTYILRKDSNEKLKIIDLKKIIRDNNNFIIKHLDEEISNINEYENGKIRELFYKQ